MVPTVYRFVVLVTVTSDSRASVGSVVRRTDIVCRSSGESTGTGSDFGVTEASVLVLASPTEETTTGTAAGVVVGWARTEALLLLVVARESDLHEGRDEEEEAAIVSRVLEQ